MPASVLLTRRSALAFVIGLLAFGPGCKSVPSSPQASPAPAASSAHPERELATAQDRLAIARLQLDLGEQRAESTRARKQAELELARGELTQFDESDTPNQLAKSKLELARRRDSLTEQQEELSQLEMLYEKQDLADKTREIVLQRGRRRVERAQDELTIAEREAATLETRTLPRQRARLALGVEAKARELAEGKPEAEVAQLERRLALRTAEAELQAAQEKAAAAGGKP